jgi:hypothetical protein
VFFGDRRAQVTRVSRTHISAIVPAGAMPEVQVSVAGSLSAPYRVRSRRCSRKSSSPSPIRVRSDGSLYVTFSGSRGEKSRCRSSRGAGRRAESARERNREPHRPRLGPDDCLYVSSRQEGSVYRIPRNREAEMIADELGIATGIAFDREGILYVGDRREPFSGSSRTASRARSAGSSLRSPRTTCAFDCEGNLFVTAPASPRGPVPGEPRGRVECS